jgi:uncharacterized protein (DUF1330 family)
MMAVCFRSMVAVGLGAALAVASLPGAAHAEGAKGYIVVLLEIQDSAWMEEYGPPTNALIEKHGGRFLAADRSTSVLEGDDGAPSIMAILEFPSAEAASAWYGDPDYQPLIKLRQTGATADLLLAKGVE